MELTKEEIAALGLLPCPFCGHEAHIRPWHGGAPTKQLVACGALYDDEADICPVSPGVRGETPKEAGANWNFRTGNDSGTLLKVLREVRRKERSTLAAHGGCLNAASQALYDLAEFLAAEIAPDVDISDEEDGPFSLLRHTGEWV